MTAESAFKRETIMSALIARTGRLRQRYDNGLRLVSGCIPYRLTNVGDGAADLEHQFQVLMISSPNRGDLVFPKGGWEDDETMGAAACREALEEAGVRGELDEDNPLGFWVFRSKSRQDSCSLEGYCKGYMFALEVTEELECWPEQVNHERRWLSFTEAFELCRYDWMREALKVCRVRVLFQDMKHHVGEDAMVAGMAEPASEVADHPIPLPSCFMKSSDPPHLENPINALC